MKAHRYSTLTAFPSGSAQKDTVGRRSKTAMMDVSYAQPADSFERCHGQISLTVSPCLRLVTAIFSSLMCLSSRMTADSGTESSTVSSTDPVRIWGPGYVLELAAILAVGRPTLFVMVALSGVNFSHYDRSVLFRNF